LTFEKLELERLNVFDIDDDELGSMLEELGSMLEELDDFWLLLEREELRRVQSATWRRL
jgi:hypothetical protein